MKFINAMALTALVALAAATVGQKAPQDQAAGNVGPDGVLAIRLDTELLAELGLVLDTEAKGLDKSGGFAEFSATVTAALSASPDLTEPATETILVRSRGALLFERGGKRLVVGDLALKRDTDGRWLVVSMLGQSGEPVTLFTLDMVLIDAIPDDGLFRVTGDLLIAAPWATLLGEPDWEGIAVGWLLADVVVPLRARMAPGDGQDANPSAEADATTAFGPDVIVGRIDGSNSYGSVDGVAAFSIGTISCNAGDEPLSWYASTNQHPVIAQNAFRLQDDRFVQIGQAWLKHGFAALTGDVCGYGCVNPGTGSLLGVGCSDPYSAGLNGAQYNLGPKSEVNAHTGYFPFPSELDPETPATIGRRLQIHEDYLSSGAFGDTSFFAEAHYVSQADSAARQQNNNASYCPVTFTWTGSQWQMDVSGETQREQAGIQAWRDMDRAVQETPLQVDGEGLFIMAAKSVNIGNGNWRYEYAVQNLNSDRSGGSFSIPVVPAASVSGIGFHSVEYHSFEVYSNAPWVGQRVSGAVTWTTESYASNPNANALRWGTLYNFWFESDAPPQSTVATLGLFKPGTGGDYISGVTVGPMTDPTDCNGNGVADNIDVADGTSQDCNGNLTPDECETFPAVPLTTLHIATALNSPVYVAAAPGDATRLFIVQQGGLIRILRAGSIVAAPFLDLTSIVSSDGERGLLSMAFDPAFGTNDHFYVNYTDTSGDTVIARYTVSGDPDVANATSQVILKTIAQDFSNHNGGQLQFGADGMLYVGMGDGGGADDELGRAQSTDSLLGKMLRLDVNNPPAYIPADNPFAGPGLPLDEIWSLGLRNPWRFSFDRLTHDLYIADVGQGTIEEIDFAPSDSTGGENFGWRCMEGTLCTGLSGCTCNDPSLTLPIFEYGHGNDDCSVTGGYVYRGCELPFLSGTYFYADYCTGRVWSLRYDGTTVSEQQDRTLELAPVSGSLSAISSFGEDNAGNLYIVSRGGDIFRIAGITGAPLCGDGNLEGSEECDDGNLISGDGCDHFCLWEQGGGDNDLCADALPIGEGVYAFDNAGATTDGPDEPTMCNFFGDTQVGSDIWYCYTSSCAGTATVSLCGSSYDTKVAVYDGCTCPTEAASIACSDDACGTQSEVSFPVSACGSYLIRVGGYGGAQGPGSLSITCNADPLANDCNGNDIDDATDIACGMSVDLNGNGIPDECDGSADFIRGGRLYDRWWSEIGAASPTTDHPLWAYRPDTTSNPRTGADTHRCKECHGWDYKGVDGVYGTGSHRTGFPGTLPTTLTAPELITLLTEPPNNSGGPGVPNGHDFGASMTAADIADVVAFVILGQIDDDNYIDPVSGEFLGSDIVGEEEYTLGGTISCITCHGPAGTALNFGTPQDPEYLGTIAVHNPWEFIHKVRFSQPATPMPSWLAGGGDEQGAADIGRYAQLNFPVDCVLDAQCNDGIDCTTDSCDATGNCAYVADDALCPDDGIFCNGPSTCRDGLGCIAAGNSCVDPSACDEDNEDCGCVTPEIAVSGGRYLAIAPVPSGSTTPIALTVQADCPGAPLYYVGSPNAADNVAVLVDDPGEASRLPPDLWGTVLVTGLDVIPNTAYLVSSDCGNQGSPSLSAAAVASTQRYGDVVGTFVGGEWTMPDGTVDFEDISATVDAFRQLPAAPSWHLADLVGCMPDRTIDFSDITGTVDGFRGLLYVLSTGCPGPCE